MYRVETARNRVKRELKRIPKADRDRIGKAVSALSEEPRPEGAIQLQPGVYRIRVGEYRIVYRKNGQKFVSLWRLAEKLGATLLLVNYSKKGTAHEDEVLVMEALSVDPLDERQPVRTRDQQMSRAEFSRRFRALNQRGRR